MKLPDPKYAVHQAHLYRLLMAIYDNPFLAKRLYFKGGTCAAMLGILDRFSVDLNFDLVSEEKEIEQVRLEMEKIFKQLGFYIKDKSKKIPQYFLGYDAPKNFRNTLKIDISYPAPKANKYKKVKLTEIDRIVPCQTPETMFANKLVALIDRYETKNKIAGRDLYDIHYFYLEGIAYDEKVIIERRNENLHFFFAQLMELVKNKITQKIIDQDLNMLLPSDEFKKIRKIIATETYVFLGAERLKY